MNPFTYKNYIYYKHILESKDKKHILQLYDVNETYNYKTKNVNQPHDKIFREVLDDKEEASIFINKTLGLKSTKYALKEEDLEKYNRRFITDEFRNLESDVVYRKKNQNIFFLIEHQSRVDYSMPYRILKYSMAIMESAIDKEKVKSKDYKLPIIFSFVIYTGEEKWKANQYLIDKQEKLEGCAQIPFGNFQVVDINDYKKEELLKNEDILSKVMLLEKAKNIGELENNLSDVISRKMSKKQIIFFKRIIYYILYDKISKKFLIEIMEKLNMKRGDDKDMTLKEKVNMWIDEMIKEKTEAKEEEFAKKEESFAKKEEELKKREKELSQKEQKVNNSQNHVIVEMMKNHIDETTIMKITRIDKKELEKIKRENKLATAKIF